MSGWGEAAATALRLIERLADHIERKREARRRADAERARAKAAAAIAAAAKRAAARTRS